MIWGMLRYDLGQVGSCLGLIWVKSGVSLGQVQKLKNCVIMTSKLMITCVWPPQVVYSVCMLAKAVLKVS